MFGLFKRPKTWKQHFNEGMAHGAACNFAKAERSFCKAIRLAPDEPYPHYELGYTLSLVGRHAEALEEFQKTEQLAHGFFQVQTEILLSQEMLAGRITPDMLKMVRALQDRIDRGIQSEHAATVSRQLIALAPEFPLGYYFLGLSLRNSNPEAAEEALRRCLELHPDDTTAISAKSKIAGFRANAGEEQLANRMWREIVADYPGNPNARVVETFFIKGEQ